MVFQVIRNSLQRIVGHLCQSSSVHRCHRQLVWFCSLFLSFVSHRVRFGREIVEFGGKDGEFVRGRHVERKEREGGRASRLFLSVVSLGCFLTTSARKERRIYKFTLEKRLQRKSQKCGHDNGFCDAKLPSSELQSTCALCILFFLSSSRQYNNCHSQTPTDSSSPSPPRSGFHPSSPESDTSTRLRLYSHRSNLSKRLGIFSALVCRWRCS